MACVNLVFPLQKLNSNDTLQRETRRFNAVSVVQFTVQMSKFNGLGKTHQERIFVAGLKLKLRSLFHYERESVTVARAVDRDRKILTA